MVPWPITIPPPRVALLPTDAGAEATGMEPEEAMEGLTGAGAATSTEEAAGSAEPTAEEAGSTGAGAAGAGAGAALSAGAAPVPPVMAVPGRSPPRWAMALAWN